ncbi:hypothetical protein OG369_42500 [Streptomyces sp. NBC_01221]|uniref:hypothetical protein n=1 Tax=Streptomyces sp. NBC_01221 TaxID=2903782 RepID=UPI0022590399|nr:hypothetical protein [Streptomyces sp. NBC_01221]MCX4792450.1 hypothetical protein [Streptomyces sp. NBC_01221]
MGTGADDTAAQRLRLLQQEFVQPVRTGPGDGRSSRPTHAPAPVNLGVVDRIRAAVYEVEHHTRTAVPDAGQYTGEESRVYDWARQHTAHLEADQQNAREAIIYRQGLEHAIAAGDTTVIRRHPCPQCGCWGLYWREAAQRAVCVNHYCTDDNGVSHMWELKRLAQDHVARKSAVAHRAT